VNTRQARVLGSAVILCATLGGCVPLVSRQDPVRVEAARFVDSASGATVPEVLVLPRFASYSGVATGHGSGNMAKAAVVAEPRIQRSGETLLLSGGSILGLWWAFVVVTGRYLSLDGALVVGAGYRAAWVEHPWKKGVFEPLILYALPPEQASAQLEAVAALLGQQSITVDEALRIGIPSTIPVRVQLDGKEKQAVRDFVASGLSGLRAQTESLPKKSDDRHGDRLTARWSGRAPRAAQRER
jgi:hypothetical protein